MGDSQLVLSWASRTYREECTIVAVAEATGTRGWESAHGDSSAQQQYVCNAHDENKGTAANATRKGVVKGAGVTRALLALCQMRCVHAASESQRTYLLFQSVMHRCQPCCPRKRS